MLNKFKSALNIYRYHNQIYRKINRINENSVGLSAPKQTSTTNGASIGKSEM